jgi:carboxymethylenebutenolidase
MAERTLRVRTPDGEMPVFVVHPNEGGPFPIAILFMDAVGFREQVKENARRFAAGGFYVAAPDLFYRHAEGIHFDFGKMTVAGAMDSEEGQRMMAIVRTLTPENVESDTRALLAALAADPEAVPGPRVSVGYCMGARLALHMASAMPDEFAAAAGIHPAALVNDDPDSPHLELRGVKCELFFAFAEVDRTATEENIERFRVEMERAGVRGAAERWPGVTHGFAMADLPVYDREAAERHFERVLEVWRRNLRQPVSA